MFLKTLCWRELRPCAPCRRKPLCEVASDLSGFCFLGYTCKACELKGLLESTRLQRGTQHTTRDEYKKAVHQPGRGYYSEGPEQIRSWASWVEDTSKGHEGTILNGRNAVRSQQVESEKRNLWSGPILSHSCTCLSGWGCSSLDVGRRVAVSAKYRISQICSSVPAGASSRPGMAR